MPTELIVAITSSLLTAVIGPIAVNIVKNKLEEKNKKDNLQEYLQKDDIINNKLIEIREKHNADRIWVTQFHNGGIFYPTGKSIQKFSMTYENVDQNVESIQQNFQNIPVSLFSTSKNQLLKENIISIPDFKDPLTQTFGLKHIAESTKCKSSYLFAIKSIDNKFIGTLGIEYIKRKNELCEDDINEILIEATSIGGVLAK